MKLRLRSLETKETLKMEVPNTSTFLQLTTQTLSSLPSPSLPPPSITFSLNGKDPLHVSSPDDSLRSLGITSGDLIYFSLEHGPSSSFSGNLQRPIIDKPVNSPETESLGRVMGEFQRPIIDQTVNCMEMERLGSGMGGFREKNETLEGSLVNLVGPGSEISGIDGDFVDYANRGTPDDAMPLDLEGEHEVEEGVDGVGKRFSEPYFLRRVLREELDGDGSVKKTGLALPPCLMRLPVELKLKILESLSGVDVARTASVCTELRRLASNNELWKQKFEEEFGNANVVQGTVNWKERFVSSWVRRSWVSRKGKRSIRPRLYIYVGD